MTYLLQGRSVSNEQLIPTVYMYAFQCVKWYNFVQVAYIGDITLVVIPYEIYQTSLWRV